MLLLDVELEPRPTPIDSVPIDVADKASILDIFVSSFLLIPQLCESVNDYAENDIKENDQNDQEVEEVEQVSVIVEHSFIERTRNQNVSDTSRESESQVESRQVAVPQVLA